MTLKFYRESPIGLRARIGRDEGTRAVVGDSAGAGRHLAHDGDPRHRLHPVAHHLILLYMRYPIYSILAIGCFFHPKTRITYFSKGYSLAYLIVSIGPFMIIPNVGLNEWDHTFWFMEELFIASRCTGASCSSAGWPLASSALCFRSC
jgi:hypothetical protein